MLPVVHGSIHFRPVRPPRQCCSCPPELFVDKAIGQALKREKARAKRRTARVTKRWAALEGAARAANDRDGLSEARAILGERFDAKQRLVMAMTAFDHFAFIAFNDKRDLLLLQAWGVIRKTGDHVEFWCADGPFQHETMQTMLGEAGCAQRVFQDNCFQVCLEGEPPLVFPWRKSLTLAALRRAVAKHVGGICTLRHLGVPLRRGLLSDQGVGPGSFIVR